MMPWMYLAAAAPPARKSEPDYIAEALAELDAVAPLPDFSDLPAPQPKRRLRSIDYMVLVVGLLLIARPASSFMLMLGAGMVGLPLILRVDEDRGVGDRDA